MLVQRTVSNPTDNDGPGKGLERDPQLDILAKVMTTKATTAGESKAAALKRLSGIIDSVSRKSGLPAVWVKGFEEASGVVRQMASGANRTEVVASVGNVYDDLREMNHPQGSDGAGRQGEEHLDIVSKLVKGVLNDFGSTKRKDEPQRQMTQQQQSQQHEHVSQAPPPNSRQREDPPLRPPLEQQPRPQQLGTGAQPAIMPPQQWSFPPQGIPGPQPQQWGYSPWGMQPGSWQQGMQPTGMAPNPMGYQMIQSTWGQPPMQQPFAGQPVMQEPGTDQPLIQHPFVYPPQLMQQTPMWTQSPMGYQQQMQQQMQQPTQQQQQTQQQTQQQQLQQALLQAMQQPPMQQAMQQPMQQQM